MKFSRIIIKNFRSISDEPVTIQFEKDRNIYALIGPNNSGKTNILDAIGLVLDSTKFYGYFIEKGDFYNQNIDNSIEIIAELVEPLLYRNVYQQKCEIREFKFEAKKYTRGGETGRFHVTHYCHGINAKGMPERPLLDSDKMYKAVKTEEDADVDNRKFPVEAKDELRGLGSIYYLEPHRLFTFYDISGRGPLGRLFRIYKEDFSKSDNFYKDSVTSKEAFNEKAKEIKNILRTRKLEEIETKLLGNLNQYLGLDKETDLKIHLGLPEPEQFMKNLIELLVKENQDSEDLNVLKLGSGYLSLLRIATLQTLAEMKEQGESIFLIEEPETYLHPHLRRFFYKVLKELANKGNQIIYTTQSIEFVSLDDYQSIIKVCKDKDVNTIVRQIPKSTSLNFNKMERKLKGKGNEEIYFCNYAILTEGQNDSVTFSLLFDKKGIDRDAKSISIVDCGSKNNLRDYIALCNELEISYFVIFDHDKGNEKSMTETSNIRKELGQDETKFAMFDKCLEVELGLKKDCKVEEILAVLEPLTYEEIKKRWPKVIGAVEKALDKYKQLRE